MLALAAGSGALVSCEPDDRQEIGPGEPVDGPDIRPESALPADAPRDALQFFNPHQGETVDAIAARLIPDDEDALAFFLIGGVLALLMRLQLAVPEGDFLVAGAFNQAFTMHGTVMMFLFALPSSCCPAWASWRRCWPRPCAGRWSGAPSSSPR